VGRSTIQTSVIAFRFQGIPKPLAEECFRLEILECRRSLGEDVIGQTDFADSSRHCNGPDQRAEY